MIRLVSPTMYGVYEKANACATAIAAASHPPMTSRIAGNRFWSTCTATTTPTARQKPRGRQVT